ncbi:MAG: hypothetical protein EWV75_20945 [Microcystis wesenbergii Mw_QC_S_20081001_S30D]|jgi:hypothetical protein|uniref:Uncharacterized protein n=2 Tax=Microcystis wesenbergii TaxID=44823 RepID=A0A552LUV2_9CHRO|nr:MAG: hypothetical protein EWV75_20945 [Microcystis wesenbergii Mw_QC_S_20081001_S30D]TRV02038.1 MAG: hypothetical protein EWV73_08100 [Microcystis wesenbergii Mw_QC_B_20070930_S4D]TRV05171.1 MAG: hypothetical protein EWV41_16560 [Microcystis wesenbergii Mw_MB_S_20031200_S109]TRV05795.1 MAG: hypothetical protein EWV74_02335 [Microcystis wesenbergii Mw_QC_S_20081001_S30]TRV13694.1 MAG: hypothetical protein EWV89_10840 [Microcystis wesenbergii Mw_QC_B_20070930_S4]TRV23994.1 MAG: hypothetical p
MTENCPSIEKGKHCENSPIVHQKSTTLIALAIYQWKGIQGLWDLEGKFALVILDGSPAATFPRHC